MSSFVVDEKTDYFPPTDLSVKITILRPLFLTLGRFKDIDL